jgi:hypothetical protein
MGWVRIDDNFPHHPKVVAVGATAMGLYVAALCHSNVFMTDGFVSKVCLGSVLEWKSSKSKERAVSALVAAGLWTVVEGGYQIHDYLDYQPSRAQIVGERDAARERMRARRSGNVRPNKERTEEGVRPNFGNPNPTQPKKNPKRSAPPKGSPGKPPPFHTAEKRAGPIPPDFQPSPEMLAWAAKQRPNVDAQDRTLTFVNHAIATGRELVEWEPAWKNWILDSKSSSNGSSSNGHPPEPTTNRARGWDRSRETYEQYQARTQIDG